jgi:hypothetical protein
MTSAFCLSEPWLPSRAGSRVHLPVARSVASGENIATCDALTGGNFKDAPHPNAAKLYLTWFLAKEQQSRLGSFSRASTCRPPEGFQPFASY